MVKEMEKIGRNITAENFFASLSLAEKLETQQLTLLGTLIVKSYLRHSSQPKEEWSNLLYLHFRSQQ